MLECIQQIILLLSGASQGFAAFDQKPSQSPFANQPTAFADFSQSLSFDGQGNSADPFGSLSSTTSSAASSSLSFDAFSQGSNQLPQALSNTATAFSQQPSSAGNIAAYIIIFLLKHIFPSVNIFQIEEPFIILCSI